MSECTFVSGAWQEVVTGENCEFAATSPVDVDVAITRDDVYFVMEWGAVVFVIALVVAAVVRAWSMFFPILISGIILLLFGALVAAGLPAS